MTEYTKRDIIELAEEEDVSFMRLQFTDVLGRMRNMAVTRNKLMDAINNKCMFDGSSIEGFAHIESSDMYLIPDLNTFTIFPWRPHQGKVGRLICDIQTSDGKPFEGDPRYILKKVLKEAEDCGYEFNVGPECEFFLFKTDDEGNPTLETHDDAGYFDLAPLDNGENCRREICLTLEEMGFEIEASHHEAAKGQHEIDFKYAKALETADRMVTFKTVVKTIAKRHGLHATFMPKPMQGISGSGMHINMSLSKNGKNIFYDENDSLNLSKEAYSFIAGLLKYTPDMMCITNPIVNSYKRIVAGFEAPCYIAWSAKNRSPLIRIPSVKDKNNVRIELRSPDSTANPYLVIAACLKAGLAGIKENLQPPSSIDINLFKLSENEVKSLGIKPLPISLNQAIQIAKKSDFVTELLGKKLKETYLEIKEKEYSKYRQIISNWEIENYLTQY